MNFATGLASRLEWKCQHERLGLPGTPAGEVCRWLGTWRQVKATAYSCISEWSISSRAMAWASESSTYTGHCSTIPSRYQLWIPKCTRPVFRSFSVRYFKRTGQTRNPNTCFFFSCNCDTMNNLELNLLICSLSASGSLPKWAFSSSRRLYTWRPNNHQVCLIHTIRYMRLTLRHMKLHPIPAISPKEDDGIPWQWEL